jgi:hypothetical protein
VVAGVHLCAGMYMYVFFSSGHYSVGPCVVAFICISDMPRKVMARVESTHEMKREREFSC